MPPDGTLNNGAPLDLSGQGAPLDLAGEGQPLDQPQPQAQPPQSLDLSGAGQALDLSQAGTPVEAQPSDQSGFLQSFNDWTKRLGRPGSPVGEHGVLGEFTAIPHDVAQWWQHRYDTVNQSSQEQKALGDYEKQLGRPMTGGELFNYYRTKMPATQSLVESAGYGFAGGALGEEGIAHLRGRSAEEPGAQPPPETPPSPGAPPSGGAPTPAAAPIGQDIGIKFPNAPSRRATVDTYFDNGQSVRLRFDDGTVGDYLTSDILRDQTAPPPPRAEAPAPDLSRAGTPLSESESFDLMREAEYNAPPVPNRRATQPSLGTDSLNAILQADALERRALQDKALSDEQRQDMLAQAQRLRRQFGSPAGAPGFSDEEMANAAAARQAGTVPNIMGQEVPAAPRQGQEFSDEEIARAQALRRQQRADKILGQMVGAPEEPVRRPMDLLEYLSAPPEKGGLGGVQDDGGDLRSMDAHKWHLDKPFRPKLIRDNGVPLDKAREAAVEQGYGNWETLPEFKEAIDQNLRGRPVYADQDLGAAADYEASQRSEPPVEDQIVARAHDLGIEGADQMDPDELLVAIQEREAIEADAGQHADEIADKHEREQDHLLEEEWPEAYEQSRAEDVHAVPLAGEQHESAREAEAQPEETPVPHAAGEPAGALPGEAATGYESAAGTEEHAEAPGHGARPEAQGVTPSTPEPAGDIRAQIQAMLDPGNAKDAVFVAAGNESAIPRDLPPNVIVVRRPEGALLTTSGPKAMAFRTVGRLTDADMARLLGYPETKQEVLASGQPAVVQARDAEGHVVSEAVASAPRAEETAQALAPQVPEGGDLVATTPEAAQARRAEERAKEEPVTPGEKVRRITQLHAEREAEARGERVAGSPAQSFETMAQGEPPADLVESRKPTLELAETVHTRDKYPLYVARIVKKLPEERFRALASATKKAGGYYSSFRGKGAVPGFQFKDRATAERFVAEHNAVAPEAGRREAPVKVERPEDLATAERHVETEPSDAQKEAGNYEKGHVDFQGLPVTIENPKGSMRRGVGPDGQPWEVELPASYGYIKKTEGADGDHVDAYIGPDPQSKTAFVVDQVDADTGKFDEHKVMLGYPTSEAALADYRKAFSDGRADERIGAVTPMSIDELKDWLKNGDTTKPISYEKPEPAADESATNTAPGRALAEDVSLALERGPVSAKDLQALAERAYGSKLSEGKFDRADMYDALELGVNRYIQKHADEFDPRFDLARAEQAVNELRALKEKLPTQSVRAGEKETHQQFSTPPDYAYAASWVANIRPEDRVLEPSAGTGSLAVHAMDAHPAEAITNEISDRRAGLLSALKPDREFRENAEQLNNILPEEVRPTAVVMNPPFSATAGRMGDRKVLETAAVHIEQAMKRLQLGGRLVAIVGRGMTSGAPRFRDWFNRMAREYNYRANVGVDGSVYSKYGTGFDTRLLVFDKTAPTGEPPVTGDVKSVADLLPLLEGVRNDRPEPRAATGEQLAAQPARQEVAPPGEGAAGRQPSLFAPADLAGVRERPAAPRTRGAVEGGSEPRGRANAEPQAGPREANPVVREQPERPGYGGAEPNPATEPGAGQVVGGGGAEPHGDVLRPAGGGESALPASGERADVDAEPGPRIQVDEAAAEPDHGGEITEAVYESYKPQRVTVAGAKSHPGELVQSAAMASVLPPKPSYAPKIPTHLVNSGGLSDAQLESVIYAGQAHSQMLPAAEGQTPARRGFFIGDGTGVGKGREVAGIILDNWMRGRKKAVWISEKKTLINDAKRDWKGLGQDPRHVLDISKVKAGSPISADKGVLFSTYDTLKSGERMGKDEQGKAKLGKTRVDQIVDWLGPDFDGVIAFDEAHNMANAVQVKGGRGLKDAAQKALAGVELQKKLPNARVVYVSATGATEVSNLAYAERLGLWGRGTAFPSREDFINKVQSGGIAAMELVARDMKALGHYIARNLSYRDVEYNRLEHVLSPDQRLIYDKLAEAWQVTLNHFDKALELTGAKSAKGEGGGNNVRAISAARSAFWGAHQRFFNQIITAMQMPSVIRSIERDMKERRQSVLQLVNTNEASQERALAKIETADELEDLDMTPRDQLMQLVEHSFPVAQHEQYMDEAGNIRSRPVTDKAGNPVENREAVALREQLLDQLGSIRVPEGPLEMLLNHFGSDKVAEVTGRKQRVVRKPDDKGQLRTVVESRPGNANVVEADAFQTGRKPILVFSEAGGTGRSYHAERGSGSEDARRAHYLVQSGWRADKAIQGFGRTHRTNQASAPIFHLVTTDLKGQKRFISSIARRLAQLGALTKGERRAGDQGLFSARDNLESKEAGEALYSFFRDLFRGRIPDMSVSEFQEQTGLRLTDPETGGMRKELPDIPQFLNRLLSLKIDMQNKVFDEFERRLGDAIDRAAASGTLDTGVETVKADRITKADDKTVYTDPDSGAETRYVQLKVQNRNHPASFDDVLKGRGKSAGKEPVFFARSVRSGKTYAVTEANAYTDAKTGRIVDQYRLVDPLSYQFIDRPRIDGYGAEKSWRKVTDMEQARKLWDERVSKIPEYTTSDLHLITGAVLPIWDRLGGSPKVFRLQTDAGERMLGRVIPDEAVSSTLKALGAERGGVKMAPEDIVSRVMEGGRAQLANGWTIRRATVAGEPRLEIQGPDFNSGAELRGDGVFSERIDFRTRYFIPTGEDAAKVLSRVIERRPVTDISSPRGEAEGEAVAFQRASAGVPAFYSALERGIESAKQDKAPAGAWKGFIKNLASKGVKQEELDWSGVLDWLDTQKGPVAKADLLQHVRDNDVHVREVMKGGEPVHGEQEIATLKDYLDGLAAKGEIPAEDVPRWIEDVSRGDAHAIGEMEGLGIPDRVIAPFRDEGRSPTKFGKYRLPGGENYRELLLTLPPKTGAEGNAVAAFARSMRQRYGERWIAQMSDAERQRYDDLIGAQERAPNQPEMGNYRSPHWGEPNILAHVRFDDRIAPDGAKVLHVAEIQSDWHQAGRKKGYAKSPAELADLEQRLNLAKEKADDVLRENDYLGFDNLSAARRAVRYNADWADRWEVGAPEQRLALDNFDRLSRELDEAKSAVPNAPFKTSWHELALKRILRYAAENGYDRVSWDSGDTNASRYDLSKHIDTLDWSKRPDGSYDLGGMKNGADIFHQEGVPAAKLDDIVGKDIADKIRSGVGKNRSMAPDHDMGSLSGVDLKVGGEGMRAFYDKILPTFANKYVKKWGARVREGEVATTDYGRNGRPQDADRSLDVHKKVHVIDITPEMRESVLQGQPLFDRPAEAITAAPPEDSERYRLARGLTGDRRLSDTFAAHEDQIIDAVDEIANRMVPGARVRGFDRLASTGEVGESGPVYGAYYQKRTGEGIAHVVAWSLESPDAVGAVRHEAVHYLRRAGLLDDQEWATLAKAAQDNGWLDKYRIEDRYPDLDHDRQVEEAVAEQFADWRRNGLIGKLPEPLRKIAYKVDLFLRRVAAAARQVLGRNATADDVFAKMEAGDVGRRGAERPGERPEPVFQRGERIEDRRAKLEATLPDRMPRSIRDEIAGWGFVSKSPHSDSFYSKPGKTWDYTAPGTTRVSDHWNFDSQGETHARTDRPVPPRHWAIGDYDAITHTYHVRDVRPDADVAEQDASRQARFNRYRQEANAADRRVLSALESGRLLARSDIAPGRNATADRAALDTMVDRGFVRRHLRGALSAGEGRIAEAFAKRPRVRELYELDPVLTPTETGLNARIHRSADAVLPDEAMARISERSADEVAAGRPDHPAADQGGNGGTETPGGSGSGVAQPSPLESPHASIADATKSVLPARAMEDISRRVEGAAAERPGGEAAGPGGNGGVGSPEDRGPSGLAQEPAFQRPRQPEQPEVPPAAREYLDDVSDQIAEANKSVPPGTYARRLAQMLPDAKDSLPTKFLGAVEKYAIMPRTLAATDWRSARFWEAWRQKDDTANSLRHRWSEASQGYTHLTPDQRRNLHAVEELDRLDQRVRTDEGRRIVARNESHPDAEFTKPGQSVVLDPETTAVYHQRREMFRDVWRNLMQASAKRLGWDGSIDPKVIREAAERHPDKATARRYGQIADLMQAMADQERSGYTPLMRFGDYYIAVTPKVGHDEGSMGGFPETARFELADSVGAFERLFGKVTGSGAVPKTALDRIAELRKKYPEDEFDIQHGYLARNVDALRKLDIPAVEKLFMALQQKDSDLFGPMVEELRSKMYEEMKAGFKKRARTVPGYSDDFERATGTYLGWVSHHIADLLHAESIRNAQESYIDRHPDPAVRRYWQKWTDYQQNPAEEMQRLRNFGFLWQMALNPSSMAVVAMHGPMAGHATLSTGIGIGQSGRFLYGAMGEAMKAIRVDGENGLHVDLAKIGRTADEKALVQKMAGAGALHAAAAEELMGMRQGSSEALRPVRKQWDRTMRIAGSTVGVTDQVNRAAMTLAAYRLAKQPGMLDKFSKAWGGNQVFRQMVEQEGLTPKTVARFMVDEGLFVWGKRNRAPMTRGAVGTLMAQFHNFEINYLGTLWKFMHRMGPEGKTAALFMLGGLGLMGGVNALPFAQDAESLVDSTSSAITGIDPQINAHLAQLMEDVGFSKLGAEMVLSGPSRALGVDLSGRLGFGQAISRNLSPIEALGVVPGMIYGALHRAYERHATGQTPSAVAAELAPAAVRNVLKATTVYPEQGVETARGRAVLTPDQISTTDRLWQALGFEPASIARAYDERTRETNLRQSHTNAVDPVYQSAANLLVRAIRAQKAGDKQDAASLRARAQSGIEDAARRGTKLDPKLLRSRIQQLLSPQATQVKRMPKALRGQAVANPFQQP